MAEADWNLSEGRFLSYVLAAVDTRGQPLFIVLNAAQLPVDFTLPEWPNVRHWANAIDTGEDGDRVGSGAPGTQLSARRLTVLVFAGEP